MTLTPATFHERYHEPHASPRAERLEREIEIVAVKLEPCAIDDDPFLGKLQRLAPKFRSVAEASLKSMAWEQVRKDLLPVIKRVRAKKEKAAAAR